MSTRNQKSRRRRGVTRRTRDSKGNIVVKRYKRRGRRFTIPGLTPKHIPQILIGSLFMGYSGLTYAYNNDAFANSPDNSAAGLIRDAFDSIHPVLSIFLTGILATGIGLFFGYAIMTQGIHIKRWAGSWRQIIVVIAVVLLVTTIFSAFINEPYVRQLDDDEYLTGIDGNYDVSFLDSPFYSEFLNGLLDLLGNIPDPSVIVANITSNDGFTFDPNSDRYLWRWQAAETYSAEKNDFIMGHPDIQFDYQDVEHTVTDPSQMRRFRVDEQMVSLTSSVTTNLLTPWNSEIGSEVSALDTFGYDPFPPTAVNIEGSTTGFRTINEQPGVNMYFQQSGVQGGFSYDTYWSPEDKDSISKKSVKLDDLASTLDLVDANRFGSLASYSSITDIFGEGGLTGGSLDSYTSGASADGFSQKYLEFLDGKTENTTVYDMAFQIYNQVSTQLYSDILSNTIDISSTGAESLSGDTDKALYYYNQIVAGETYGMKDMLVGLVNMLRAFDIPSRFVLGFSVGDVTSDQIQLTLGHVHGWVEALIPWVDDSNNLHFSWGIFNPVPDPYIYAQSKELEYGANALGGFANVTISMASKNLESIPGDDIEGESKLSLFEFDKESTGNVDIIFDEKPGINQPVSLRLLNESILGANGTVDMNTIDPSSVGVDLGTIHTNASGIAEFTLNATRAGILYRILDNGGLKNITEETGQTISAFDPLAAVGSNNIYIIVAIYGVVHDIVVVGWNINSTLSITSNITSLLIPDGGGMTEAGGVIQQEPINLTITVNDKDGAPVEGENTVDLLKMSKDTFVLLEDQINAGTISPGSLQPYIVDTFDPTNVSGKSSLVYSFGQSDTEDQIYALVANIHGTTIIGKIFMYLSNEVIVENTAFDTGIDNIVDSSIPDTFSLDVNAYELVGPISTSYAFQNRSASNVDLVYYAIEKNYFELNIYGQGWNALAAEFGSCADTATANYCYFFNTANPNNNFNVSGGDVTDTNGFANAIFKVANTAFSVGDYVIIIANSHYQTFANTTSFRVLSPPAFGFGEQIQNSKQLNSPVASQTLKQVNSVNNNINMFQFRKWLIVLITIGIPIPFTRRFRK